MRPVFDPSAVHHLKHKGAVDADGHVLEDAGLWDRYIEAKYRDRALRMKRDADGLEYLEIGGQPSKRTRKGYPATLAAWARRTWKRSSRIPTRPTPPTCPTAPAIPGNA
jgi:hypothetical protein